MYPQYSPSFLWPHIWGVNFGKNLITRLRLDDPFTPFTDHDVLRTWVEEKKKKRKEAKEKKKVL